MQTVLLVTREKVYAVAKVEKNLTSITQKEDRTGQGFHTEVYRVGEVPQKFARPPSLIPPWSITFYQHSWYCHFDDDVYVNVPKLVSVLSEHNPIQEKVYIGR